MPHKRPSSGYIRQAIALSQESTLLRLDAQSQGEDNSEEPMGMEGQIAQLNKKMDQLMSVVMDMQEKQGASGGSETPHASI